MKILFASRRPAYPFFLGGAEKSFFELATALGRAGHSVCMLGDYSGQIGNADHFFQTAQVKYTKWYEEEVDFLDRKVPKYLRLELEGPGEVLFFHNFLPDFMPMVEGIMESFQPELICTQLEGAVEMLLVAKNWNLPVLHFVRDIYNPINFFAIGLKVPLIGRLVCVANSEFVRDYVRQHYDTETTTVYPLIPLLPPPPRANAGPRKRILFVNPIPSKGGDVVFQVAQLMPEIDFELVPGWAHECGDEWQALPNVLIQKWPVGDMATLYARADIVLVASQDAEAFGRVGIEAQNAGVPVIASKHSGIEESMGNSAVLEEDYSNPQAWVAAIRSVMESPEKGKELVEKGKRNIERFSEGKILEMFEAAVEKAMQMGNDGEEKK